MRPETTVSSPEHVVFMKDMEALLRRLQARERVDFGWQKAKDWFFDTAGREFYDDVRGYSANVLRGTQKEVFYENLENLYKLCETASREENKKMIRTRELEDKVINLWIPIQPHLKTFYENTKAYVDKTTGVSGMIIGQVQYSRQLLNHMEWFVLYYNKRYKTNWLQ